MQMFLPLIRAHNPVISASDYQRALAHKFPDLVNHFFLK